jgi:hypothetical protein
MPHSISLSKYGFSFATTTTTTATTYSIRENEAYYTKNRSERESGKLREENVSCIHEHIERWKNTTCIHTPTIQ